MIEDQSQSRDDSQAQDALKRSRSGQPEGDSFYRPAGAQPRGDGQGDGSLAPGDGPRQGQRIAHFTLGRFIAKGGMGQVWEAWDEELRRAVALKLVLPERIDARSLALFAREAQAGGRLAHPSIVTTLGHGTDGGRAWIAQELVEGSWTLKDFLDELRAADAVPKGYYTRVAGLVAQLADALHAAHGAAVVHRDVKPQNILIAPDETPKLTDFGLARVTDDSFLSITGEFAGTYAYMSPEQVMAKRMGLDHRTDVFSLGIVLYELLSLRRPFEGDTTHQIAAKIITFDPPEPSKIRSQCPRELSIICGKALEKDPDRRYQTMAEFAADLRRHLAHEPIHARPPGPITRAIKWSKRNPALSSSGAVAVVALAVVSSLLVLRARTAAELASSNIDLAAQTELADRRADETAEQARIAEENAQRAEANAEAARLAQLEAEQRTADVLSLSAQKDLDDLIARAATLWPPHPEMLPRYERWLAEARLLLEGRPADPEQGLKARPSLAEHRAKLAELQARSAPETDPERLAAAREDPRWAELESERAAHLWHARMLGLEPWPAEDEVAAQLAAGEVPDDPDALWRLALSYVDPDSPLAGRELEALRLARRAVAGVEGERLACALEPLAWALFRTGRLDEALQVGLECQAETADHDHDHESVLRLPSEVERWRGDALVRRQAELGSLAASIRTLETELGLWTFEDPEDSWWHRQLSGLVAGIEGLHDPETGLAGDSLAEAFGWGVGRRQAFADTITGRSVEGGEARRLWAEATRAIESSPHYGGLVLEPQMGLLPIGSDPGSGLWEFAHLMSGDVAQRDEEGRLILTEDMGIVLVLIPGGTFWMGAQPDDPEGRNYDPAALGDEGPPHEVELSPYFLSKYAMTQGQWKRVAGVNPGFYGHNYSTNWNREGRPASWLHPVEQISWTESMEMMGWLDLSLPSEAQWECAARAGTSSVYWTGDDLASLSGAANVADAYGKAHGAGHWTAWEKDLDDGNTVHARVGSYRANLFGLHGVHGNVWEWCLDGYSRSAYRGERGKDPVVPWVGSKARVNRGGSFSVAASNPRSAFRNNDTPEFRFNNLGLRPSRGITP